MNVSEKSKERKAEIRALEGIFLMKYGIRFSKSYRQFLLERGTARVAGYAILGILERAEKTEKEPERGTILRFWPGDLRRGRFAWISNYEGRIVGLCSLDNCKYCNPTNKEQLKSFKGGELRVDLHLLKRETGEFYVAHFVSFVKPVSETKKQEQEISVVEATEFLRIKRPDIVAKKFFPVCFSTDLSTGKQMALCMDLSDSPKDDAPLVMILDINQQNDPVKHDPGTFSEWITYLKDQENQSKKFTIAKQRIRNRKNEVRRFALEKEIEQKFGQKCPVCGKQERVKPLACQQCHEEWRNSAKDEFDFAEWVQKKLEEKGVNLPKFSHKGGKDVKHVHVRPHDWHARIFRVADYVVGITAFRYNYQLGCLEVDAFWSGDLAGYAKGQAIRNLAIAVLSEANSLTGSLALAFTRDVKESEKTGRIIHSGHGRTDCPVPQELVDFAEENSILLSQSEQGVISHQDGLNLFWAALGWPKHLQTKVDELEKKGYLNKQTLANVIYSGIWSKEEAVWLFENASRPEAVLLGSDLPEDRLYYTESLAWARSAYLANLLKIKVSADLAGGLSVEEREESDCELEPCGGFWLLKSAMDFTLPWMTKGSDPVLVKANEPVLVHLIPRQTTQEENDLALIKDGFKSLKQANSQAKIRCLIASFEFSDLKYGMKVAEFMKNNSRLMAEKGVYLLFSPYRLDLLNDEVENRMFSARRKRQFPSRKTPLRLQLIEIPETRWQKPDLLYSVQDAEGAAYWIEKKIDLRLGRIRFRVNCNCLERIAVQDAEAKIIAVIDGQDSKTLLNAVASESGIILPFVLPSEMSKFAKKADRKLRGILKGVKGGLVVVSTFEKSEASETAKMPRTTAKAYSVSSKFHFSVDPNDIDLSNYAAKRHHEIARTHQQIQSALRTGEPLAVSYLRHETFIEAIREYLSKKGRMDQVSLRIVYSDGTEGQPFPLFCLAKRQKPKGLYQMRVGSISMRHAALDLVTDGYLIQNVMISKRRLSSAEQEDYAFRQTSHFLADFVDLVRHKRLEELFKEIRFKYLWNVLKLESKKGKGCELHIFQTGLVPATVGIYQAVVKFLRERRGELVVVPRLIGKKAGTKEVEATADAAYLPAAAWF